MRTTIDLKLQRFARDAIAKVLPPQIGPTAALVSLDANTGAVLAMVGGRNYHRSQFNLATQGERQPGSAFKPFVLAAALQSGISPSTTLESHPVTIDVGRPALARENYEGDYVGTIDLRKAIAYSDNSVFAQLTNIVGPQNVADAAKALGIGTPLQSYFSIGLGGEPATPLEMARAYAAFANGGYRIDGVDLRQRAARRRVPRGRRQELRAKEQLGRRAARARGPAGRDDRRPPAGRGQVRDREGGAPSRVPGRGQDRHDGELRRRVVRRLHAGRRDRRLGRLSGRRCGRCSASTTAARSPAARTRR